MKLLPGFLSESFSTGQEQQSQTDVVPCGRGKLNDTDDERQYKAGEGEKLNAAVMGN